MSITIRRVLRASVAVVTTAVLTYGIARQSGWSVEARGAGSSRLRLSWTARPERIEVCHTLSAAELAALPEHMRRAVDCDGRAATYALRVESDGRVLHESVVRGSGLRHDRPLYLLRDLNVVPGTHHLRVVFARREPRAEDRSRAAIPPLVTLDTTVRFETERALVITLDLERHAFVILGGG